MKYKVIVPDDVLPLPKLHEMSAARLLSVYFKKDVVFIKCLGNKTADISIDSTEWEIKSPTGGGKRNIQHQLSKALKQSPNIVFDARRSKLHIVKIERELEKQFKTTKKLKRLLLIKKDGNIVAFHGKI